MPPARRRRGKATAAIAALPLLLPTPATPPRFVVDPADTQSGAGNDVDTHTVTSRAPLNRFMQGHESFHTLDHDQFTDLDQQALGRILRPGRPGAPWQGATGPGAGSRAGTDEVAADYYGAAKTNLRVAPRKRGALTVSDQEQSYTPIKEKRLRAFRVFMDQWARRQMLDAKQPSTADDLVRQVAAVIEQQKLPPRRRP